MPQKESLQASRPLARMLRPLNVHAPDPATTKRGWSEDVGYGWPGFVVLAVPAFGRTPLCATAERGAVFKYRDAAPPTHHSRSFAASGALLLNRA